jgi:hypothetical protein
MPLEEEHNCPRIASTLARNYRAWSYSQGAPQVLGSPVETMEILLSSFWVLDGGRTRPRPHPNPARARRKCEKVSNFTIRCVLLMLSLRLNPTWKHTIILNYANTYRLKSDCTKTDCNRNIRCPGLLMFLSRASSA